MKRLTLTLTTLLAVPCGGGYAADNSPSTYTFKSLSVEAASKAAWGAIFECRKKGYSVAVAVVDRGGNTQALLRDRFAGPHTLETALRKAWTANSFRQSTAELAALLHDGKIPDQNAA